MASRMRVTSLMDEARCYQALPITAKTIGYRTQDGTLNCRNEVSSSPDQNCAKREGERNCGNMERAKGFEPDDSSQYHKVAPLLVASGEVERYRQLCHRIVAKFGASLDPATADRSGQELSN